MEDLKREDNHFLAVALPRTPLGDLIVLLQTTQLVGKRLAAPSQRIPPDLGPSSLATSRPPFFSDIPGYVFLKRSLEPVPQPRASFKKFSSSDII